MKAQSKQAKFLEVARSYLGYTTSVPFNSVFGERLGIQGTPWDGVFIDFCAREASVEIPSTLSTSVALSHYTKHGRLHVRPKVGDIVFLEVSTVTDFGQPHVGIVVDTSKWLAHGIIETIEGMVSSGSFHKQDGNDGVYQRVRNQYEVIAFGRPDFKKGSQFSMLEDNPALPAINYGHVRPNISHPYVEVVQHALSQTVGLRKVKRGTFDAKTKASFAKFQRNIGYPASRATGHPDTNSLKALANKTGLFSVQE